MRRPLPHTVLLLIFASAPAIAQTPAMLARPMTVWVPVEEPMSVLLNRGHRIVSAIGPSFTLERGGKYVICEIRPAGGMSGTPETTSTCHRLG